MPSKWTKSGQSSHETEIWVEPLLKFSLYDTKNLRKWALFTFKIGCAPLFSFDLVWNSVAFIQLAFIFRIAH
jgi:hypothetical protein